MKVSELSISEYHSYYKPYIDTLGDIHLMEALENGLDSITDFMAQIPDSKMHFSYADGKWSVAEILVHLMDAERVFQYRTLRFARNDDTELKGFDQDIYVPESSANSRNKKNIEEEFIAIRKSSIALFNSLGEKELMRIGIANGATMSVRALAFVICGHQSHHFKIINERYL